jgi:hypothetical protein
VREVSICGGGRKRSDVFFPAKNLRNVPWEVVWSRFGLNEFCHPVYNLLLWTTQT